MSKQEKVQEPTYTLYYFNVRGAAEAIRLIFAYKGIKYEDVRIEQDEWPQRKNEMPQKMMPCLEINGVMYCQSPALLRHLGREFGLYGTNNMEALVIDEFMETINDMTKGVAALFAEQDPEKKKAGMKKVIEETYPKFLPFICKRLKENTQSGFVVGKGLTIADLAIYRTMEFLRDFMSALLPDYSLFMGSEVLKKHYEMMEQIPQIKEWVAKRPKTQM